MCENAENKPKTDTVPSKKEARAARQAEALRANLRRRKAQSRARQDSLIDTERSDD